MITVFNLFPGSGHRELIGIRTHAQMVILTLYQLLHLGYDEYIYIITSLVAAIA